MLYLNSQPYPFVTNSQECNCCSEDVKAQLVNQGDITNFQNVVTIPTYSTQKFTNPSFDDGSIGWILTNPFWVISGGKACKVLTGVHTLRQDDVFTIDRYYTLFLSVESLSGDVLTLTLGGETHSIETQGEYTFSFQATSTDFRITGEDDTLCCITEVKAYEVYPQYVKWIIKDSDGLIIDVLDQVNDPNSFELTNELTIGYSLTGYIDWTKLGISNGCYTIGIADPNTNTCVQNFLPYGEFDTDGLIGQQSLTGWQLNNGTSGNWEIIGSELTYTGAGTGEVATAIPIYGTFCEDLKYEVEISIGAASVNFTTSIKLGTTSGAAISTIGVHTQTITSNGDTLTLTVLTGVASELYIEYIRVSLKNEANYTADEEGPTILLGDHECTHLVNACHNGPVGNFDFSGSFRPMLRLDSKIGKSVYPATRTVSRYSNGSKRSTFADIEDVKQIQIDTIPEYMHQFLRLLRGFIYTAIDNQRMHVEDTEYTPVYATDDNCRAGAIIDFSFEPTPNNPAFIFRDTTGIDKICKTSNLLLLEDNENYVLQPNTGRIILE